MVSSDEISRKLKAKLEGNDFNTKIETKNGNKSDNGSICPNCSDKNPSNAVFCAECGKKLEVKENTGVLVNKPPVSVNKSEKKTFNKVNKPIASTVNKSEDLQYNQALKPSIPTKKSIEDPSSEYGNMVCSDCGAQNRMNAEFCIACGKILGSNLTTGSNIHANNKSKKIQFNKNASSGDFFANEKKGREKNLVLSGIAIMVVAVVMFILAVDYLDRLSFMMILLFIYGLYTFIKGLNSKDASGVK